MSYFLALFPNGMLRSKKEHWDLYGRTKEEVEIDKILDKYGYKSDEYDNYLQK